MAKLLYKNKVILGNMSVATSIFDIAKGLMFAKRDVVDRGMCLEVPYRNNAKYNASVTMFFCFCSMDILFVNFDFDVVDKVTLKPWRISYTPKQACKYIVESVENKFESIKIGDKVKIKN